jgi:hypothetical protein
MKSPFVEQRGSAESTLPISNARLGRIGKAS